ncbi:hypothetical protein H2203_005498 [Taxawa tesnikishii (nom. ined.)]|nr:hypothetical protein H2203_005498 [Dothideales sp. JES 119]
MAINVKPATDDLTLPRILCLHGGGVTGEVFRAQARALIKALPSFRLVFADGPSSATPAPASCPAAEEVMYAIRTAKDGDAGTGPWVGMLGFSQGAKLAASLLHEQQVRVEREGTADTDYRFAVLLAGRQPLISFSELSSSPATLPAGAISEGFQYPGESDRILRLPTIHVHGLSDPGLHLHRQLMDKYCDRESVTLVEWDGTHRVPLKKTDVDKICTEIYRVAREQGVKC